VTTIGFREWTVVTAKTNAGIWREWELRHSPGRRGKPPSELCGVLLPPSFSGPPWQPVITTARCTRQENWPKHLADLGYETRDPFELARLARAHLHEFRPLADCTCGLWVYREPYKGRGRRELWTPGHTCACRDCGGATRVVGAVLLAGRIRHHEHGYRAQHAMVIALAHRDPDRLRQVLRADYRHIPVAKTWKAAQPFIDRWKGGDDDG
jgi:hypothetical protein